MIWQYWPRWARTCQKYLKYTKRHKLYLDLFISWSFFGFVFPVTAPIRSRWIRPENIQRTTVNNLFRKRPCDTVWHERTWIWIRCGWETATRSATWKVTGTGTGTGTPRTVQTRFPTPPILQNLTFRQSAWRLYERNDANADRHTLLIKIYTSNERLELGWPFRSR